MLGREIKHQFYLCFHLKLIEQLFFNLNFYFSSFSLFSRGVTLQYEVIIGPGSCIGTDSFLTNSSIGKGVKIGKNVNIKNCIVLDQAVIQDNCQLEGAILGGLNLFKREKRRKSRFLF